MKLFSTESNCIRVTGWNISRMLGRSRRYGCGIPRISDEFMVLWAFLSVTLVPTNVLDFEPATRPHILPRHSNPCKDSWNFWLWCTVSSYLFRKEMFKSSFNRLEDEVVMRIEHRVCRSRSMKLIGGLIESKWKMEAILKHRFTKGVILSPSIFRPSGHHICHNLSWEFLVQKLLIHYCADRWILPWSGRTLKPLAAGSTKMHHSISLASCLSFHWYIVNKG